MFDKIKNWLITFLMFLLEVVILLTCVVVFKLICISTKFIPSIGETVYSFFMFVDFLSFLVGIFITTMVIKRFFRNSNLKRRSLKWLGIILLVVSICTLCANIGSYMEALAANASNAEPHNILYSIINICAAIYCLRTASSIEDDYKQTFNFPTNEEDYEGHIF